MTTTIDTQIQKALDTAEKARAKAAALAAQKAEADAAETARRRAARTEFEAARAAEFPQKFARPVRQAREAFNEAVTSGGDYLTAWVTYQAAQAVARAELEHVEARTRTRNETQRHEWAKRCKDWNDRLHSHIRDHGTDPHPALAALNAEITETAASAPKPITRRPEDTSPVTVADLWRPFTSQADRFTDTDLYAAINRAVEHATRTAVEDYRAARDEAIRNL